MTWRLDPFTRIQRWVGDFTEPDDSELVEFGYERNRTKTRRRPIKHGTDAGYGQHRRRGETACDACKQASNIATQISKARRDRKAA